MPEPLLHVSPGQPLLPSMKASTWNRFIDMANDHKRQFGPRGNPAGLSRLTPSIRVLIQNDTGADLDEFAVVQVSDPAVIPIPPVIASSGVLDNRFDVNSRPLLSAVEVNDLKACYVVTCEPIAEDTIGEAVICGVTVVKVNIQSNSHKFADVAVGSYNLKSGETGRARIVHKESTGTGEKLCVVHIEQIPSEGVVPASADCSIQINTCPIFKWIKNVAGVLTEYTTDPGSAIRVQDGITVSYQGWCGSITAGSWTSGTATVTSAGHPLTAGDIITITSVTPTGYNVSSVTITATTSTTISYAVASDPGTYTSGGTISAPDVIYCVDNPDTCCAVDCAVNSSQCFSNYPDAVQLVLDTPVSVSVSLSTTAIYCVGLFFPTSTPGLNTTHRITLSNFVLSGFATPKTLTFPFLFSFNSQEADCVTGTVDSGGVYNGNLDLAPWSPLDNFALTGETVVINLPNVNGGGSGRDISSCKTILASFGSAGIADNGMPADIVMTFDATVEVIT